MSVVRGQWAADNRQRTIERMPSRGTLSSGSPQAMRACRVGTAHLGGRQAGEAVHQIEQRIAAMEKKSAVKEKRIAATEKKFATKEKKIVAMEKKNVALEKRIAVMEY